VTIRYYVDDDIASKRVLAAVSARGIEIRSCDHFGMRGAADEDHLEFSASNEMALVTGNRGDFSRLHWQWVAAGRVHAGIVVVLQTTSIGDQVRGLVAVHELFTEDDIRGECSISRTGSEGRAGAPHGRIRHFPD